MDRDQDQYWDEIDNFLERQQTADKRQAFEKQMQQSPELSEDVNLQRSLHRGIAYRSRMALKTRLKKIHEETQDSAAKVVQMSTKKSNWKSWLSVAAVLVFVSLGIVFWAQQSSINQQELFAANYSPYELDLTKRGEELPDQLAKLATSYSTGDFSTAAPLLDQALEVDPNNATLALARAIVSWENGDSAIAQQQLELLFDHPLLKDQAYWYAALFALEKEQTADAIIYFEKINADSGRLYQQASKLLKQLK